MKANGAPEKIYLQVCGDCTINDKETCEQCYKDYPIGNSCEVTWCVDRIFKNDVEYTRTDAFIEKACEWLSKNSPNYINYFISHDFGKFVEDFRKAQKGE